MIDSPSEDPFKGAINVTLAEAVSFLAWGKPKTAAELSAAVQAETEAMPESRSDEEIPAFSAARDLASPEPEVAAAMRVLLERMADGRLAVFGIRRRRGDVGTEVFEDIPPDYFRYAVALDPWSDSIGVDPKAAYPEFARAFDQGGWEDVRMRRVDLLACLPGGSGPAPGSGSAECGASEGQPPVRPAKGGRKPGSGAIDDSRWLGEMDKLLGAKPSMVPYTAARKTVHRFPEEIEGTCDDAKIRRLERKYRERLEQPLDSNPFIVVSR